MDMATKNNTVIIIAGPTAVGKTAVAVEVAKHFQTGIISADSRQCYREMNIGVARPSEQDLAAVPHYFIASHSIHQKVNAVSFEQYAIQRVDHIFQSHDIAVMVGGTGLYIKAFCEGLDDIPEVSEVIHNEVIAAYQSKGLGWLQKEVEHLDPEYYRTGEIQNPQRLMRALEVFKATGQSIVSFRRGIKAERPFRIIKIALELPKEQLYHHINYRVDAMMKEGLAEEVRALIPYQHLNALQTVGYKELFSHFNGEISLHDAVVAIKQNTRHYAKRQLTWFRKDKDYAWFSPIEMQSILNFIDKKISTYH